MKRRPFSLLCEEPFRLFFPLAVVATVGGVALWPLFHYGAIEAHPGVMHARIMTTGLAGFLLGFLGTAFPRLVSAPRLTGGELCGLLFPWLVSLTMYFLNQGAMGDAFHAATMFATVLVFMTRWIVLGGDTPPPGGPVALLGLLMGGIAALALAWQGGLWMSGRGYRLAQVVLYQAPVLLALIGVGPYLLPRFLGHPSAHRFDDSRPPPPGWWTRCGVCGAAGGLILISFVLETGGAARAGMLLRAGAVLGIFLGEAPVFRRAEALSTPGTAVRVAILSIALGLSWASFDPMRRVGILHLVFITGYGLVMLAVGVRVILGHAGRQDLLEGRIVWLRVVIGLALLAVATRVSADFLPRIRLSHLDYAAVTWALIGVLWLWKLGYFLGAREEERASQRGPKARNRSGEQFRGGW